LRERLGSGEVVALAGANNASGSLVNEVVVVAETAGVRLTAACLALGNACESAGWWVLGVGHCDESDCEDCEGLHFNLI